jgi:hypothetical protein
MGDSMHTVSQTGRRVVIVILVTLLGLIGYAVVQSYQGHDKVRLRALQALQAGGAAGQPQNSTNGSAAPSGTGASTGLPGLAGAGTLPGLPNVVLPIGAVDVNPPSLNDSGSGNDAPPPAGGTGGGTGSTTPPPSPGVSVAVLTPLISSSKFGASVGFLLACNTGAGTLSAAAAQVPGLSKVLAPVLSAISPACGKLSDQAVASLTTLNSNIAVLQAADPMTAPYFKALNQVFRQLDVVAPQLPPLEGLIEALGPMVAFFQGLS